jgi:hypothetical protein
MALTKSFQFSPPTNLKEALGAFIVLLIIGAINLGQQWEERRFSVQHFTAEIQCMLKLNESQAQQLEKINYAPMRVACSMNRATATKYKFSALNAMHP